MKTSAEISLSQINALNLVVPSSFTVKVEKGVLKLVCYSPEDTPKLKPLFAYEILPLGETGYEGELVAELIEDLSGTVSTLYNVYSEEGGIDILERVLSIVNGASQSTSERLLTNRAYKIMTDEIYTVDATDWFG